MPVYDRKCENDHRLIDCFEPINQLVPVLCPECGAATERTWFTKPAAVIQDSIEGGVLIHHGLCHPDGTPRRFYSNSEIARAAKEAGYVQHVEHRTLRGTDKSKHTVRWIAVLLTAGLGMLG